MKKWTYPQGCIVKDSNGEIIINVITQFYPGLGSVYVAVYYKGEPVPSQFSVALSGMKKFMQQFKPDNLKIENPSVEFLRNITITETEDGFKQERGL